MVKISKTVVHSLRNQGKTFADIGKMFDVSRQYIFDIYSGRFKVYAKTEKYKMYKRHYKGHKKPYKPCVICKDESMSTSSVSSINPSL